jgi:hypothetical protein
MKFLKKSREVMGDFVALHGRMPLMEQPEQLRGKIPRDEVWIREDHWDDPGLKTHEKVELNLMDKGLGYKPAHRIANKFEDNVKSGRGE